jgi:predicted DNA-binding transcriptional regulator YafY
MARTGRLLELLIALQTKPRFTVAELAARFGVSQRTMLRDLHELSALGLPLGATPGPHGGYTLLTRQRLGPFLLTTEEAVALILSYEAFEQYPHSPFAAQSLSAITKLRAALPPTMIADLDRLRQFVAVQATETIPAYNAPHLTTLLQAAVDGQCLRITYESRTGRSERRIWPFGLYAAAGFWYCACHDERRDTLLSLRADRILAAAISVDHAPGHARPALPTLRDWLATRWSDAPDLVPLRLRVTSAARRQFDFTFLGTQAETIPEQGGSIEARVPLRELDYYATRIIPMGTGVQVEEPPELIALIRQRAETLLAQYQP